MKEVQKPRNPTNHVKPSGALCFDLSEHRSQSVMSDILYIHILQKVTAKDVQEVALKYVYDRCPAVAAVGPVENLPDYNRIRSSMYWLRL
jgi:hypothetical protein